MPTSIIKLILISCECTYICIPQITNECFLENPEFCLLQTQLFPCEPKCHQTVIVRGLIRKKTYNFHSTTPWPTRDAKSRYNLPCPLLLIILDINYYYKFNAGLNNTIQNK